ncbi:tubulin-dependent ATPase kip3, partial [Exophiala xenobiotica]
AKKGVSFTPKRRKSPIKVKRAVRWRDDTEDGTLAEFEKTPQKFVSSSPEESTTEITVPQISNLTASLAQAQNQSPGSSPIPPPPESSLAKSSRFQAGFLSKKYDGSPMTSLPAPKMTSLSSSDSEPSPLREIDPSKATNRRSMTPMTFEKPSFGGCADNASNSSSDAENHSNSDKDDAMRIRDAVKRSSSLRRSGIGNRTQRRRSPTAATGVPGSPPNDSMFAAGHVRRMVMGKTEKENDWK